MSVTDNFKTFCTNIVVKNKDTIATRYNRITKRLNLDFWNTDSSTAHSLYVGSYGRNTAIAGISDVDMLMEMPHDLYWKYDAYATNGQSAFLQLVKASIAKTYPSSSVAADGQVIMVNFDSGPYFEVLPVFTNKAGTYTFADTNGGGSWKAYNPRAELEAMRNRNKACNDNLKWLCRMMRSWKEHNSVPIPSFLLDTLAYNFIDTWAYKDKSYLYYDFLTRDFFEYLAGRDTNQQWWAAPGSGQRVYRDGKFEPISKLSCAKALEAIAYEDDKKPMSARKAWRILFGSRYPET